jgi:hypothetical protein
VSALPPNAARPPADLRGRHDLGEIVGYGWRIYLRNFSPLFALALLTVPVQMLVGAIQARVDAADRMNVTYALLLPNALVSLIAGAAVVDAVHRFTGGVRPSFGESLDAALGRFWALFTTTLLSGAVVALSVLAVPGLALVWLVRRDARVDGRRDWWFAIVPLALTVYLIVRWQFVAQAVMVRGQRNWAALDESAGAVRGAWWRTFGVLLVLFAIEAGFTSLGTIAAPLPPLAAATISGVIAALALPFSFAAQTLLYYDLKARQAEARTASTPERPAEDGNEREEQMTEQAE